MSTLILTPVALHADEPDAPRWAQETEAIPAQNQPKRELPTLNADAYINLKAQHPDKTIGVHVDGMTIYYGSDAETSAPVLGKKLITREVAGLGETPITGTSNGWQSDLIKLVEKGNSVLFVGDDGAGSYETIKERTAAEYIHIGMELTIDGRSVQIDGVDFNAGTVSLRDMELDSLTGRIAKQLYQKQYLSYFYQKSCRLPLPIPIFSYKQTICSILSKHSASSKLSSFIISLIFCNAL